MQFPQVTIPKVAPRVTKHGNELPIVGLIVDAEMSLDLQNSHVHSLQIAGTSVHVIDGAFDEAWHVVAVHRTQGKRTRGTNENFVHLKVLESMGVRQCFSGSIAKFDQHGFANRMLRDDVIDLSDAPSMSASLTSTSCGRLLTGLSLATHAQQFELVPGDIDAFIVRKSEYERSAAGALGMCYASIDVLPQFDEEATSAVRAAVARALLNALDSISLMATCTCLAQKQS